MFPGTASDSSGGIPATSADYRELLGRTQDRQPASAGDNQCSAGADTWLRCKQFVAAGTLRLQRIAGKNGSNEQASGLSPLSLKTTSKRDLCRFYRTPDLETDLESLPRPRQRFHYHWTHWLRLKPPLLAPFFAADDNPSGAAG